MMPKWIEDFKRNPGCCSWSKGQLTEALTIAVEALETVALLRNKDCFKADEIAKEALNRIEALGK